MVKILAIPGSLRTASSSNLILSAVMGMAPAGVIIEKYEGVGALPHFNDPEQAPDAVLSFRARIQESDAVLICTPEYAFGVPGSLKNALDWTVSSGEFIDKPVGLITASSQGEKGHAALLLTLQAISAKVIPEGCLIISFVRSKLDADGHIKDPSISLDVGRALAALIDAVRA
jgi:NAD(P)H-dependent FMN reductase